ncbi:helix-turn-helix transcriptional regulator [Clostridium sp. UBA7339]|uniref:helix-turn-helix transcriptional regulator n=1 Tax=Clostridium sp. UBA7339 TaxID=1946376 RepID=UPI003217FF66
MDRSVEFISGNKKIKLLRKQLRMTQQEFQDSHFTRGYLGLLENGRRNITLQASKIITEKFMKKAKELNIELELEEDYFSRSVEEDAKLYCEKILKNDLSMDELNEIMNIGEEYNLNSIEAKVYRRKGDLYFGENQYLEAYKNYFYSMDILRGEELNSEICYVYNRLGYCKFLLLDYEEAIVYFNKAIYNAEMFKDEKVLRYATYNLSVAYSCINKFQEAIDIINKFIHRIDMEKRFLNYVYVNILKANCYEGLNEIDNAITILQELIEIVKEENDEESTKILGLIYNNLGSLYRREEKLSKALDYYNKSQQIRNKVDNKNVSHTLIEKANIYVNKKLYDEAIMIIELGIEKANEYNDYEYIFKGYELLEKIYCELNMKEELEKIIEAAIGVLKNTNNSDLKIKYYTKLQELYFKNKEYEKAEKCLYMIQRLLQSVSFNDKICIKEVL